MSKKAEEKLQKTAEVIVTKETILSILENEIPKIKITARLSPYDLSHLSDEELLKTLWSLLEKGVIEINIDEETEEIYIDISEATKRLLEIDLDEN